MPGTMAWAKEERQGQWRNAKTWDASATHPVSVRQLGERGSRLGEMSMTIGRVRYLDCFVVSNFIRVISNHSPRKDNALK